MNARRSTRGDLTPKQVAFCLEYLVDLNATKAAIRAGYSKATGRAQAWAQLGKPEVEAEIAKLMRDREKRTEAKTDNVLRELAASAFFDPAVIGSASSPFTGWILGSFF